MSYWANNFWSTLKSGTDTYLGQGLRWDYWTAAPGLWAKDMLAIGGEDVCPISYMWTNWMVPDGGASPGLYSYQTQAIYDYTPLGMTIDGSTRMVNFIRPQHVLTDEYIAAARADPGILFVDEGVLAGEFDIALGQMRDILQDFPNDPFIIAPFPETLSGIHAASMSAYHTDVRPSGYQNTKDALTYVHDFLDDGTGRIAWCYHHNSTNETLVTNVWPGAWVDFTGSTNNLGGAVATADAIAANKGVRHIWCEWSLGNQFGNKDLDFQDRMELIRTEWHDGLSLGQRIGRGVDLTYPCRPLAFVYFQPNDNRGDEYDYGDNRWYLGLESDRQFLADGFSSLGYKGRSVLPGPISHRVVHACGNGLWSYDEDIGAPNTSDGENYVALFPDADKPVGWGAELDVYHATYGTFPLNPLIQLPIFDVLHGGFQQIPKFDLNHLYGPQEQAALDAGLLGYYDERILDGEFDEGIKTICSYIRNYTSCTGAVFRIQNESIRGIGSQETRGGDTYVRAFRKVVDLVRKNMDSSFRSRFLWHPNTGDLDLIRESFPGKDYCDYVGMSVYWDGSAANRVVAPRTNDLDILWALLTVCQNCFKTDTWIVELGNAAANQESTPNANDGGYLNQATWNSFFVPLIESFEHPRLAGFTMWVMDLSVGFPNIGDLRIHNYPWFYNQWVTELTTNDMYVHAGEWSI